LHGGISIAQAQMVDQLGAVQPAQDNTN
jgi:hypothetical protein